MPRQLKVYACLTFVLAVMFYLFFQIVKHHPALSQVNAFADDPYDSVSSIGTQLALFTALLSLVRAFRPYEPKQDISNQKSLLMRGQYIACLSVAVTLVADVIAMVRFPSVWLDSPAGQVLIALIGGMTLLTAFVIWLLFRSVRDVMLPSRQDGWTRAITLSFVSIIILTLYPTNWRYSVPGELLTIFVGTLLFFDAMTIEPLNECKFHAPIVNIERLRPLIGNTESTPISIRPPPVHNVTSVYTDIS